jgi:transcriptional regulator with XRE-family HTH domain
MPPPHAQSSAFLANTIRLLLASRGLTLAEVSRASRSAPFYGRAHHIPHNIYDAIRRRQFNPSVYQLAVLSQLSGYRFVDWLRIFGFSLDEVARFQSTFPSSRTVELDTNIYHSQTGVLWFEDAAPSDFSASLVPLSRWLKAGASRPAGSLPSGKTPTYRFVKIGTEDAYAYPNLLPGSIVRIAARPVTLRQESGHRRGTRLFLVAHGGRLVCSPLHWTDKNHFVICSRHLPYTSLELETGPQTVILGIADMEFRRTTKTEVPKVRKRQNSFRPIRAQAQPPSTHRLGDFLRHARIRAGLSFRDASARTRVIAHTLRDPRYFCAPGSLSDYETRNSAPRHIHKIISICGTYFANVEGLLKAAEIDMNALGQLPMPDDVVGKSQERVVSETTGRFVGMRFFQSRFRQLPYFLHRSMASYFGMPELSVRDIFWAGGVRHFTHRFLANAVFLVLDRRKKKAVISLSCPKWAQPLYVFLRRDGSYLCGSYSRTNGILVIHPAIAGLPTLLRLRDGDEVEVVGRVAGIIRSLK